MQDYLVRPDVITRANVAHDFACQVAAFGVMDLPADDLADEDVDEQVKAKIDALDLRGQIGDVPAKQPGRPTAA
jgi:hypothetical protein